MFTICPRIKLRSAAKLGSLRETSRLERESLPDLPWFAVSRCCSLPIISSGSNEAFSTFTTNGFPAEIRNLFESRPAGSIVLRFDRRREGDRGALGFHRPGDPRRRPDFDRVLAAFSIGTPPRAWESRWPRRASHHLQTSVAGKKTERGNEEDASKAELHGGCLSVRVARDGSPGPCRSAFGMVRRMASKCEVDSPRSAFFRRSAQPHRPSERSLSCPSA